MGAANSRQPLNHDELVQLLNWELAAYERCAGTCFTSIDAMAKPDRSGCNWRNARVQSDHPLDLTERNILKRVIVQTRRDFNVR
jgi:hypothetical protein